MGVAKRRRRRADSADSTNVASRNGPFTAYRTTRVEICNPTEHEHIPGTLTVYVLHNSGASLTGAILLGDIDAVIRESEPVMAHFDRDEARKEVRQYMVETLLSYRHIHDAV